MCVCVAMKHVAMKHVAMRHVSAMKHVCVCVYELPMKHVAMRHVPMKHVSAMKHVSNITWAKRPGFGQILKKKSRMILKRALPKLS